MLGKSSDRGASDPTDATQSPPPSWRAFSCAVQSGDGNHATEPFPGISRFAIVGLTMLIFAAFQSRDLSWRLWRGAGNRGYSRGSVLLRKLIPHRHTNTDEIPQTANGLVGGTFMP